jgi:hypothetical protein
MTDKVADEKNVSATLYLLIDSSLWEEVTDGRLFPETLCRTI